MLGRNHIIAFLAVAVAAWTVMLLIRGTPVIWEHLWPFSSVVAVIGAVLGAFERWIWRWSILHGWFVKRPDIRGTWRVQLQSEWIDPKTGVRVPPIACYMSVRQTFSTLQMKLMTPESESWLIAERVRQSQKGNGYQIAGVYTNEPNIELRGKRSEIHRGALLLEVYGPSTARPVAMQGTYWTDRNTRGSMIFSGRAEHVFTRYSDARQHFESKSI